MQSLGIEISDAGIVACGFDGTEHALLPLEAHTLAMPGYAFIGERGMLLGESAAAHLRLNPSRSTDRFWSELSLQPADIKGLRRPLSYAHLAYRQLDRTWKRAQEAFPDVRSVAVGLSPTLLADGGETDERLGILLGIIRDLQIPLAGLVSLDVAQLNFENHPDLERPGSLFALDVHQHETVLTRLSREASARSRVVARLPNCGFNQILDGLADRMAQRFLQETAYDVHDDPEDEQSFFLQVRRLLFSGRLKPAREIRIDVSGNARHMHVPDDILESALATWTDRLSELTSRTLTAEPGLKPGEPVTMLLSPRASGLRGLGVRIGRNSPRPVHVVRTEPGSAAAGAAQVAARLKPSEDLEQTPVITTWERPPAEGADRPESLETTFRSPTHVLFDAVAYPLKASGLLVGTSGEGGAPLPDNVRHAFDLPWSARDLEVSPSHSRTIQVNGVEAKGPFTLRTGDRLTVSAGDRLYGLQIIHLAGTSPA
ncbi:MAG: hypothetical protein ACFE0O_04920 [Opitutales bacterium]